MLSQWTFHYLPFLYMRWSKPVLWNEVSDVDTVIWWPSLHTAWTQSCDRESPSGSQVSHEVTYRQVCWTLWASQTEGWLMPQKRGGEMHELFISGIFHLIFSLIVSQRKLELLEVKPQEEQPYCTPQHAIFSFPPGTVSWVHYSTDSFAF